MTSSRKKRAPSNGLRWMDHGLASVVSVKAMPATSRQRREKIRASAARNSSVTEEDVASPRGRLHGNRPERQAAGERRGGREPAPGPLAPDAVHEADRHQERRVDGARDRGHGPSMRAGEIQAGCQRRGGQRQPRRRAPRCSARSVRRRERPAPPAASGPGGRATRAARRRAARRLPPPRGRRRGHTAVRSTPTPRRVRRPRSPGW